MEGFWVTGLGGLYLEGLIRGGAYLRILRYSCPVDVLQSELFQWRY